MLKPVKIGSNMYQGWITHTHSHLGGKCSHECSYCYVQRNRFGVSPKYLGKTRLIQNELKIDYGSGKTIFIEHMNDLFAPDVTDNDITYIISHCRRYPDNTYIFQTKNPERAHKFVAIFPKTFMLGTTIESNRWSPHISKAPQPFDRYTGLNKFIREGHKTFITIEPILDFDLCIFSAWLTDLCPSFINIGADSKNTDLAEPEPSKILRLINALTNSDILIKKKTNLDRILNPK